MVRAGLVDADGNAVTLHGLRNTCASLLLARGLPLIVVSQHLGHANPNITAEVYAHLVDAAQLEAAGDTFDAIHADGRARRICGRSCGSPRVNREIPMARPFSVHSVHL